MDLWIYGFIIQILGSILGTGLSWWVGTLITQRTSLPLSKNVPLIEGESTMKNAMVVAIPGCLGCAQDGSDMVIFDVFEDLPSFFSFPTFFLFNQKKGFTWIPWRRSGCSLLS